jgi:antitoxin component of MazEF toxin-antitoxin module
VKVGGSLAITIPSTLEHAGKGRDVSLAANRLMLVDLRGEFSGDDLAKLLESLEPRIWRKLGRMKSREAVR